jgi:hypothetical protein
MNTTTIKITFSPITTAPPANPGARAQEEKIAVAEVSRAINIAYYAGVLS